MPGGCLGNTYKTPLYDCRSAIYVYQAIAATLFCTENETLESAERHLTSRILTIFLIQAVWLLQKVILADKEVAGRQKTSIGPIAEKKILQY